MTLASDLTASVIATEPQARQRLIDTAIDEAVSLQIDASRVEADNPDWAYRLRSRADNLRAAVEAMGPTLPTVIETEHYPEAGISTVTLKDTRSLVEQRASWRKASEMIASWKSKVKT